MAKATLFPLTQLEIDDDYQEISFDWFTPEYGRAEFVICPILKKDRIVKIYLSPLQQPNAKHYFTPVSPHDGWSGIDFGDLLTSENTVEYVHVWQTSFCKQHNSHSFRFYVPKGSKSFFFSNNLDKFCLNWR